MTHTPSHCGTVILPRDFSRSTADSQRDVWDGGKLRAVLAGLAPGQRVAVTLDNQTGHTVFGVELLAVVGPQSLHAPSGDHLLVRYHHGDGTHHDTAHWSRHLGPIMVDEDARPDRESRLGANVKWDALKFWSDETGAALELIRPVAEAAGCTYGKYTLTLTRHGVHFRYDSQRPEGGPNAWGDVVDGKVTLHTSVTGYEGPHGSYRELQRAEKRCPECGLADGQGHTIECSIEYRVFD